MFSDDITYYERMTMQRLLLSYENPLRQTMLETMVSNHWLFLSHVSHKHAYAAARWVS